MASIEITDEMRAKYRKHFEWMLDKLGYAVPVHKHIDSRGAEREELAKMVAEGKAVEDRRRADKDGHPNPRGRSWQTIWRRP